MRLIDKLRLLAEYAPLLSIVQSLAVEKDPYNRAMLVMSALDFLAEKSATTVDNEVLRHARAVLGTEEGRAAFSAAVDAVASLLSKKDEVEA